MDDLHVKALKFDEITQESPGIHLAEKKALQTRVTTSII